MRLCLAGQHCTMQSWIVQESCLILTNLLNMETCRSSCRSSCPESPATVSGSDTGNTRGQKQAAALDLESPELRVSVTARARLTLFMDLPMPPCIHRILPSMEAANGRRLKSSLIRRHTNTNSSPKRSRHSSRKPNRALMSCACSGSGN